MELINKDFSWGQGVAVYPGENNTFTLYGNVLRTYTKGLYVISTDGQYYAIPFSSNLRLNHTSKADGYQVSFEHGFFGITQLNLEEVAKSLSHMNADLTKFNHFINTTIITPGIAITLTQRGTIQSLNRVSACDKTLAIDYFLESPSSWDSRNEPAPVFLEGDIERISRDGTGLLFNFPDYGIESVVCKPYMQRKAYLPEFYKAYKNNGVGFYVTNAAYQEMYDAISRGRVVGGLHASSPFIVGYTL